MEMKIRNDKFDEAYSRAAEIDTHEPFSWEVICSEVFNIEVPIKSDKKAQAFHRDVRHKYFDAINQRCATYGDNWRLFNNGRGEIVKKDKSEMLDAEVHARIKRTADAFVLIRKKITPMIAADGLKAKDKKIIRQMEGLSQAAAMSMAGMVNQMSALNKAEKLAITSVLLRDYNAGDEDEAGGAWQG
jgi:hypothetical protein